MTDFKCTTFLKDYRFLISLIVLLCSMLIWAPFKCASYVGLYVQEIFGWIAGRIRDAGNNLFVKLNGF